MAAPPEVVSAIVGYQDAVRQVRAQVEAFATALWGGLPGYRDEDIDRMVAAIVPVSLGAQQRVVALTDSYLSAIAVAAGFPQPPGGTPADEVTGTALRGVEPAEVYYRAGVTVWTALSQGASLADAVEQGRNRLLSLLTTDLQLARTRAAHSSMARDRNVVGYRRILTGGENCGLCTLASTQRYHKGDLMPIHPGCDCAVAPIRGDVDPGQVIDPDRLEALHEAAAEQLGVSDRGGRAPDYRDIVVREHGEYGPTLAWRGQHFTTENDL